MVARKKRILFCGEFSLLVSGYGKMLKEITSYLDSTGKYEIAEMANYCFPTDVLAQRDQKTYQAIQGIKHTVYSVMPYEDEQNLYNSNPMNQFGAYRFDDVLLDFRPDAVVSWLDVWMTLHLFRSPFRKFYDLILMPAIDGTPQQDEWIETYKEADKLITYTDWAKDALKELGINARTNSPGVDIQTYFPSHKKINYAGADDMIVVGTVMRNQKRKLFPNLIKAFEKFIDYAREKGNNKLADKTYLYLHTTYPDLGWSLNTLIKESKIAHRILFTYFCRNCNSVFPSLWSDARTNCPSCHKFAAVMPSTQFGIPESVLSNIINTFDVYVQHCTNEGFGIPVIEAAACAVVPFGTDYSAVSDVIRKVKGVPIKVANYFKEAETGRDFALPSDESFVEELYKFLTLPESIRRKKGFDARKGVEKYYSWERSCKEWEKILDEVEIKDHSKTWNSSPRFVQSNTNFLNDQNTQNLSPGQFIKLCKENITGNILDGQNFRLNQWLKQLNFNMSLQQVAGTSAFSDLSFLGLRQNLIEYGGKQLVEEFTQIANNWNKWENNRVNPQGYVKPKFLNAVHRVNQ